MASTWSDGRKHGFIVSVLRAGSRRWPAKYITLAEAKTKRKKNGKSGRLAMHYRCNACKKEFPLTEIQIDHIVPVVDPEKGFSTWDEFIGRLFCDKENLQALCLGCHKRKTLGEKKSKSITQSKQTKEQLSSKGNSRQRKPTT